MAARHTTSSPLSSARSTPATFQTPPIEPSKAYKSVQVLPRELQQQVNIYLDEYLISQAIRVLLSLVSATSNNNNGLVQIPSPDYLAILNTLSIHPDLTNRASTSEKLAQANLARKYLQALTQICGPINADFAKAYRIRTFDHDRRAASDDSDDGNTNQDLVNLKYADLQNVFRRKSDFWAIIGWAFNCACLPGPYAVRWTYWKVWLEHMLDVLERDWRDRADRNDSQNSLLWHYILSSSGNRPRRASRAIFADGSQECLKLYTEVFAKELKAAKDQKNKMFTGTSKVDIENDEYGDWFQESESSADDEAAAMMDDVVGRSAKRMRTRTPSTRKRKTPRGDRMQTDNSNASGIEDSDVRHGLGSPEALSLRLRLLQLLSDVSFDARLARDEWPDIRELYTLFVEEIKILLLPTFQQIVLPSASSALRIDVRITLCDFLLGRMLASDKLRTYTTTLEPMTQDRLIGDYLPFAADRGRKGIEQQAKMSLLLESVIWIMSAKSGLLYASEELTAAAETGVQAREDVAAQIIDGIESRKGSVGEEEQAALQLLYDSGRRLKFVIGRIIK